MVRVPAPRRSHGYSRGRCLPPPHILTTAATTAACVGARCFPFCRCRLSREGRNQERASLTAVQGAGDPFPSPPPSLFFAFSLNVNYSHRRFQQVNLAALAGSWETGLFSLAAVELHHSVFTLNLRRPDLNGISGCLSVFGPAGVESECLFYFGTRLLTSPATFFLSNLEQSIARGIPEQNPIRILNEK